MVATNAVELHRARERAQAVLSSAFADNVIDADELEQRLEQLLDASEVAAIDALVADLAAPEPVALVPASPQPAEAQISAVVGEANRRGTWTPARYNAARAIVGSCELDLREAELAPGETVFDASVVLGELVVIAPPGLRIVTDVSVILGSMTEDEDHEEPRGEATVRIAGKVVLGELTVARRHVGETRRDAKKRRKAHARALRDAARTKGLPP